MKKPIRYFTFLVLVAGMLFTSCVSNKKFTASEARNDKLQSKKKIQKHLVNLMIATCWD